MFIRILRPNEEILLNTLHISKLTINYATPDSGDGQLWKTSLMEGSTNPKSVRLYVFNIAGEVYRLLADPDSAVSGVLEKIYNDAIKD